MAVVGDKCIGNDCTDELFRGVFIISKIIGLFPYHIRRGTFQRSSLLYGISIGVVGMCIAYVSFFVDFSRWNENDHLLKKLSRFLPIFTLFTVFPCNIVWLTFNAKKLEYVLCTLKRLKLNAVKSPTAVHAYKRIFFIVLTVELIFESWYTTYVSHKDIGFIYLFMILTIFLIADQFASLLYVLRKNYEYICDKLDLSSAVDFTNVHDLLGKCCREVNDCYSPQLLVIMISVFVYIVSSLYTLIIKYMTTKKTDAVEIIYLLLFVANIFHFLTACRLTTLQVNMHINMLYN